MKKIYTLDMLDSLEITIQKPSIVFVYGDLGAGKTTLLQSLIQKMTGRTQQVSSPTYVYYNIYDDIIHFDLYRMENYETFVSIGGEEILDNNTGIIFIEWPQILEQHYVSDMKIVIEKIENDEYSRRIHIM